MKLKNCKPLGLEALEDRWVPSTVRFDGSNLFVSNPLITGGASTLSVVQVANNSFQVKDGAANNGFFAVTGNITVQGNNAKDAVTVKVNAAVGLPGNLTVTTGNGASSVSLDGTAAKAFVAGNTRISVGNNANVVNVGNATGFGTGVGVTNKGSLSITARGNGANSTTIGGGATVSNILGNTQVVGFPTVTLGSGGDVFAGSVNISNSQNGNPSTIQLKAGASILGNFTVQGGQGATTLKVDGTVLGFNSFNLGNGNNSVSFAGGGPISIGNVFLTAGNGNNSITFDTASALTVLGNAFINLGNGTNSFGSTKGLTVNGNFQVTDGNGSLDVTTNTFQGVVFGNINVNNGNGNNSFTFDGTAGASVGGTFFYTGGNGGNSVSISNAPAAPAVANLVQLNVRFGNNNANVFTLLGPPAANTITGIVTWGVPTTALPTAATPTTNGFVDNGYVFTNNITLVNVPS